MRLKKYVSRFVSVFLAIGIVTTSIVAALGTHVAAQSSGCSNMPSMDIQKTISGSGEHAIWILMKNESTTARAYVSVDSEQCVEFSKPKGNGWEWVSAKNGVYSKNLSLGTHNFAVHVNGGAILVDKILATTDTDCSPVNDGNECLEQEVNFTIEGIQQDSIVATNRQIKASLIGNINTQISMNFVIDDKSISTINSAPYCMVKTSDNDCGTYDFSKLGPGQHSVRVIATTPGGQYTERSIQFEVGATDKPAGSTQDSNQPASNVQVVDNMQINVVGVTTGEKISGARKISADVAGGNVTKTVVFAINSVVMNSTSRAPYCIVDYSDTCDEWNSESLVNGSYVLVVKASSDGFKDKTVEIPFTIENSKVTSTPTNNRTLVIGNTKQQVGGTVELSVSEAAKRKLSNLSKITYSVNDNIVGSTGPSSSSISYDTTKLSNGNNKFSAKLTATNGEQTEVISEVGVRNDVVTSTTSWIRNNIFIAIFVGTLLCAIVFFGVRFVAQKIHERNMVSYGQIPTDYSFVSPQPSYFAQAGYALSAVVMVSAITFAGLSLNSVQAGAGNGFVEEMENSKPVGTFQALSLDYEDNMTRAFIRINYLSSISTPPGSSGSGTTPVDVLQTSIEAESMRLESALGRAEVDSGASSQQLLKIWTNGSAFATGSLTSANMVTVRAKADVCGVGAQMFLKIDGIAILSTFVDSPDWVDYSVSSSVPEGPHAVEIGFSNDDENGCDRNLYVDKIDFSNQQSTGSSNNSNLAYIIGDSLTEGMEGIFPDDKKLSSVLKSKGWEPVVDGQGCRPLFNSSGTFTVSPARCPNNVITDAFVEFEKDKNDITNAGVIVVGLGTNSDEGSAQNYKAKADEYVRKIRQINPSIGSKIYFITLHSQDGGYADRTNVLKELVSELNISLIDYRAAVEQSPSLYPYADNLHNTSFGYENKAKLIAETIGTPTIAQPTPNPAPVPTPVPLPTPTPTPAPGQTIPTPTGMHQHLGMGPLINNNAIPPPFPSMNGPVVYNDSGFTPFSDSSGNFRTDCSISHISYDDPIVYPGKPNAAHLHTFFGNSSVNAYSTQQTIEKSGGSTCNGGTLNRTGYWMPTVLNSRGEPVLPERVLVYYKTAYSGVKPYQVVAPPAGLRMIGGDASSKSPQPRDNFGIWPVSTFACNSESHPFPVVAGGSSLDTFCPEGARQFYMEIRFPQCWNGTDLDSFDHKSHMSYANGSGCPSSHPVALPEIQLRVKYNYYDPDRANWRLSSDNYTGAPGGYSSHADWFNGWDRETLDTITRNCWAAGRDCDVDFLGDGRKLGRNI